MTLSEARWYRMVLARRFDREGYVLTWDDYELYEVWTAALLRIVKG